MPILIANDKKTSFEVSNDFVEQFRVLRDLVSDIPSAAYPIPVSPSTLKMLINPPNVPTVEEKKIVPIMETLDTFMADDSVWRVWIRKLPIDYDEILPEHIVEQIWNIPDAPIPTSYYGNNKDAWFDLLNLTEVTVGIRIRDIYIAYLIMLRIRKNKLTIRQYEEIVDMKVPRLDHFTISEQEDVIFTYSTKKYKDTDIFVGYPEIFALLTTAENRFMPKNIFTYTPTELGVETLHSLVDNYQSQNETIVSLPNPYPILQVFLRMWTIAYEENSYNPPSISDYQIEWEYGTETSPLSLSQLAFSFFMDIINEYEHKHKGTIIEIMVFIREEDEIQLYEYLESLDVESVVSNAAAEFFYSYMNTIDLLDVLQEYPFYSYH